jgi:hypothetical protein
VLSTGRLRFTTSPHSVKFRLVVFSPALSSIMCGWVESISADKGVQVTLGFFNDIYIPLDKCPEVSRYLASPFLDRSYSLAAIHRASPLTPTTTTTISLSGFCGEERSRRLRRVTLPTSPECDE